MTIWSKVMDFYWITQLGDADFCPPVKDISVAHFLLIHCSCSHASRLVIHIVGQGTRSETSTPWYYFWLLPFCVTDHRVASHWEDRCEPPHTPLICCVRCGLGHSQSDYTVTGTVGVPVVDHGVCHSCQCWYWHFWIWNALKCRCMMSWKTKLSVNIGVVWDRFCRKLKSCPGHNICNWQTQSVVGPELPTDICSSFTFSLLW